MNPSTHRRHRGFTLLELLVCIAVIGILASLIGTWMLRALDEGKRVKCVSNLRGIIAGSINWATERNGMLWSKKDLGYSKYRMAQDPLGPPQFLKPYVPVEMWKCPAGRKILNDYGNHYTWTVATQFETSPIQAISEPALTLIVWDAFNFVVPSMYNVVDKYRGDDGAGPKTSSDRYYPHAGNKKANYGYLDGHVETR